MDCPFFLNHHSQYRRAQQQNVASRQQKMPPAQSLGIDALLVRLHFDCVRSTCENKAGQTGSSEVGVWKPDSWRAGRRAAGDWAGAARGWGNRQGCSQRDLVSGWEGR